MILAAGKGSRLKPFTDNLPKALFPVDQVPLLEIVIKKLIQQGITDIIINTHHFADKIKNFLEINNFFSINIKISHENDLLETGGGLKHAYWFFDDDEPFIVHNVDILSDINFNEMLRFHRENKAIATLAVSDRKSSRYFLFDEEMVLKGWVNTKTSTQIVYSKQELAPFAFSGIQILSPQILQLLPDEKVFSLTDFYLSICTNQRLKAFIHSSTHWKDVGKADEWIQNN